MQPSSESLPDSAGRPDAGMIKAGVVALGVGFLMAAVAAGFLAQGPSQLEAVFSVFHRISLFVMLIGLVILFIGFRVRSAQNWWRRYDQRRDNAGLPDYDTAHLGCWETEIEGRPHRMQLHDSGVVTLTDHEGTRQGRYELRHGVGVIELRIEYVEQHDSDYTTRRLSPFTRETRTLREFVVTETFYKLRYVDADRLQAAPPDGNFASTDAGDCLVFYRQPPRSHRRNRPAVQQPHCLDANAD